VGYRLTFYDWSMFTLPTDIPMSDIEGDSHANDPGSADYSSGAPTWVGKDYTFNGGTGYDINVNDDDSFFDDAYVDDGSAQTLADAITINGVTYPAGSTIENEFSLLDAAGNEVYILRINGVNVGFVYPVGNEPTAGQTFSSSAGRDGDPLDSADGQSSSTNYSNVDTREGIVDGTQGADLIDASYTDPDGDRVDRFDGVGADNSDVVYAGDGNDTVYSGADTDTVYGGQGDDSIYGGEGHDSLHGGEGADTIYGGTGNDSIEGGTGNDSLYGEAGNDTIHGGTGSDRIYGGAGDDAIYTGSGVDTVDGGEGSDTIYLHDDDNGGSNVLTDSGTTGVDKIVLATGAGTYRIQGTFSAASGIEFIDGSGTTGDQLGTNDAFANFDFTGITLIGVDEIIGTDNADTIIGSSGADSISGAAGNDYIDGGDGNDTLDGGTGADTIYGGLGNDNIAGRGDNDSIEGGAGSDTISGGDGVDTIRGGAGNDSITGGAGNDLLFDDAGDDTVHGDAGDDTFHMGVGSDSLHGGTGSDRFIANAGFGQDTVTGGEDTVGDPHDILDFRGHTQSVTVTYTGFEAGSATAGTDTVTFSEIETILLSNQADYVDASASTGATEIGAGAGDDTIIGGSGNDHVHGDAGNDQLSGGAGNDMLEGGLGNDSIDGGAGNDSLYGGAGSDTIWGGDGADKVSGGSENDTLYGGAGDDTLYGDAGDDRIEGGIGNDSIKGGAGHDRLLGDAGNDRMSGGEGNDAIFGNDGDDTLFGDTGQDTLRGGSGHNELTGGDGDDFFHVGEGHDTLTDFGFGNTGAVGDGDSSNNDFLNLGAYYDSLDELRADQADDGILNQSNTLDDEGKVVDYSNNAKFGTTSSMTVQGANADTYSYDNTGIVCFAAGTQVMTPGGEVAIETLRPGDLVNTLDHGAQPLLWVGQRHISDAELTANEELRPVMITKGALGNSRNLLVSRQHGMMIGPDHFVRAIHLARKMPGVRIANGKREVTYVHLFFAQHEIVFAEGIASESFYPGPTALRMLSPAGRADFLNLIPGLDTPGALSDIKVTEAVYGKTARPFVKPGDPNTDQLIPPTFAVDALSPSCALEGHSRRAGRASLSCSQHA
jgi:Ca2+-binding RTX toxin-like protein